MPPSNNAGRVEGQNLAITAEALYVTNLLLLPFIAFALLVVVFLKTHRRAPALARAHLEQTLTASVWIAVLFIAATGGIMLLRMWGMEDVNVWIIIIIAFTTVHASMVLLGVVGLAKAMAGKCWRYPFVGKALPPGC